MTPEKEALKTKLKATWMVGDFGQIARGYAPGAKGFLARLNLKPGTRVLDVASGTGNRDSGGGGPGRKSGSDRSARLTNR